MTAIIPLATAFEDPKLLGAALGNPKPWASWRAILKATFAEPLTPPELKAFGKLAGGRKPPRKPVSELWVAAGRRSGKSRMASLAAVYIAACLDHAGRLAPGEQGVVLVIAPSVVQAALVKRYCLGFMNASPFLASLVADVTAEEIRLTTGIVIAIGAASYRTVRGATLLAVVIDESAFLRDESSATPDLELVRAVAPSLAAAHGLLIGISSPYRRTGVLYQRHRDHFGRNSAVLVIQAPSSLLNPTLDAKMIARARAEDPTASRSEWDAEFREDIAALLSEESIEAAVDRQRPLELARVPGVIYRAFVDASAGRHDSFTLCIGHRQGTDGFVADVVRGRKAPFDPRQVAGEYAEVALSYGVREVVGDNYAGEWVARAFREAGVEYRRSDMPKSGLYLEGVPVFQRGDVSLPNLPVLLRELRMLERRTARSGKDSVDHPVNGSDDYANAVFGAMRCALKRPLHNVSRLICAPRTYGRGSGFVPGESDEPRPSLDVVRAL